MKTVDPSIVQPQGTLTFSGITGSGKSMALKSAILTTRLVASALNIAERLTCTSKRASTTNPAIPYYRKFERK